MNDRATRVQDHPAYRQLVRRRGRFGWVLAAIMLLAYFGFVLLIAFDKAFLATPVGGGFTTIGIPLGFGLILLGVLLTALYVWRANHVFDVLQETVVSETAE